MVRLEEKNYNEILLEKKQKYHLLSKKLLTMNIMLLKKYCFEIEAK